MLSNGLNASGVLYRLEVNKQVNVHIISQQDGILPKIYIPGAIWS